MVLFRRLLVTAARQLAAHPRLQAKAAEVVAEVVENEIKPRAKKVWSKAKPKIEAARDDVKNIARETDPRHHPKEFASRLRDHIRDKAKRR